MSYYARKGTVVRNDGTGEGGEIIDAFLSSYGTALHTSNMCSDGFKVGLPSTFDGGGMALHGTAYMHLGNSTLTHSKMIPPNLMLLLLLLLLIKGDSKGGNSAHCLAFLYYSQKNSKSCSSM